MFRLSEQSAGQRQFADKLLEKVKYVSGTTDLRIQQTFDQPKFHIDVDRTKAQEIGFSQREVASISDNVERQLPDFPDFLAGPEE